MLNYINHIGAKLGSEKKNTSFQFVLAILQTDFWIIESENLFCFRL